METAVQSILHGCLWLLLTLYNIWLTQYALKYKQRETNIAIRISPPPTLTNRSMHRELFSTPEQKGIVLNNICPVIHKETYPFNKNNILI